MMEDLNPPPEPLACKGCLGPPPPQFDLPPPPRPPWEPNDGCVKQETVGNFDAFFALSVSCKDLKFILISKELLL